MFLLRNEKKDNKPCLVGTPTPPHRLFQQKLWYKLISLHMHYLCINKMYQELQRAITLIILAPSPSYSNTNVHLVDSNVFAKFDEIPSLPVQDINETCSKRQLSLTWAQCAKVKSHFKHINGHGNQRPIIELIRAFMPVLVTSNFDDDSIKNEGASMETPFSHYKSMEKFLDAQGQLTSTQDSSSKVRNFHHSRASNSKLSGPILPKIELDQAFMPVLVTMTLIMILSKMKELA